VMNFRFNLHGALIGSILMSIIATCLAAGINAIEYLTALQKNHKQAFESPELWLPWNYKSLTTR